MSEPRFEKWEYRGKQFRYDHVDKIVEYGYYEEDEFIDFDSAGLMEKNWSDIEMRKSYIDQWIDDLDDEAKYLMGCFVRDELASLI